MTISFVESGKSTTSDELLITRMLSTLAMGGVNQSLTKLSPHEAAQTHDVDAEFANRLQPLLDQLGMTNRQFDSLGGNPLDEVLYLSREGVKLFDKYRQIASRGSSVRRVRFMAAAQAILHWRDQSPGMAVIKDILETPFGYFCGDPLQENELLEAFDFLREKRLIKAHGAFGDPTLGLQLTPSGKQCVVRYDADVDEYEQAFRSGGVTNTYNMANVSNFVAGDNHGTMNAWNQIQSPGDAAALLAAAIRIASLNGEIADGTTQRVAQECHDELLKVAQANATPEVRRTLADKVKALTLLAADKSAKTATTVLASEGVKSLLEGLIGQG